MHELFNDKETPGLSRASQMLRASMLAGQLSFWAPSKRTSTWFRFNEGSCLFRFMVRIQSLEAWGQNLTHP